MARHGTFFGKGEVMICEGCKVAKWDRTANGRLHPSGGGRCMWEKVFRIAGSTANPGEIGVRGGPVKVTGGRIDRRYGDPKRCDTFERGEYAEKGGA